MKSILLALFVFTIPVHAIIIEDSDERLVFDLQWQRVVGGGLFLYLTQNVNGTTLGDNGSTVTVNGHISANPYFYLIGVNRNIGGVISFTSIQFRFQGDWENNIPAPEPVFGTSTSPLIFHPADHIFAVPGNDHAMRVVVGLLPNASPVPDGGSTLLLLVGGLLTLCRLGNKTTRNASPVESD